MADKRYYTAEEIEACRTYGGGAIPRFKGMTPKEEEAQEKWIESCVNVRRKEEKRLNKEREMTR